MKKRELVQWEKNNYFEGMLLFAQALEEGAFHCSYESYRIPALNSHFFCYDMLSTIKNMEEKVLMDGNFVPLAEEFEQIISEDLYISNILSKEGLLLYIKDKKANYRNLINEDYKAKIKPYKEIAEYIRNKCECNHDYLKQIRKMLFENIFAENLSEENKKNIYFLTRMLITELVNGGYSKEFVYLIINKVFFDSSNKVTCSRKTLDTFFSFFNWKANEYIVLFGTNKKGSIIFNYVKNFDIEEPDEELKKKLNLQRKNDMIVKVSVKELDEYVAFREAYKEVNKLLSLHRINQHAGKEYVTKRAVVRMLDEDRNIVNEFNIKSPDNLMKRKGNISDIQTTYENAILIDTIKPSDTFFKALELHNGAIENKNLSNQLLNLWTILEIVVDTKRDNEDKINTICTILCSVLNRSYLYENIEQLLLDINACTEYGIEDILSVINITKQHEDINDVEKFTLLLSLKEYEELLENLLCLLNEYPLLKYRIKQFSNNILTDSKSLYEYLERHENKIRWHVMRIYRNRNMIVHDGTSMSYRDIIVENLHFYVDALFDTIIEYYHLGMKNHASIYKDILNKELEHHHKLGMSLRNSKKKQEVIALNETNVLDLVFNGYRGKRINRLITDIVK